MEELSNSQTVSNCPINYDPFVCGLCACSSFRCGGTLRGLHENPIRLVCVLLRARNVMGQLSGEICCWFVCVTGTWGKAGARWGNWSHVEAIQSSSHRARKIWFRKRQMGYRMEGGAMGMGIIHCIIHFYNSIFFLISGLNKEFSKPYDIEYNYHKTAMLSQAFIISIKFNWLGSYSFVLPQTAWTNRRSALTLSVIHNLNPIEWKQSQPSTELLFLIAQREKEQ